SPPAPPPANVPDLAENGKDGKFLTMRERMQAHRNNPVCASCHNRMDPLGFGLENFDAVGRWRTELAGETVDASGTMITGEKFKGPAELKKVLLGRKDEFVRNLTEK